MASERIERSTYVEGAWNPSPTGTHITLPLDAALLDDAAVEAAAAACFVGEGLTGWDKASPAAKAWYHRVARAAVAAYARHVAGGKG